MIPPLQKKSVPSLVDSPHQIFISDPPPLYTHTHKHIHFHTKVSFPPPIEKQFPCSITKQEIH